MRVLDCHKRINFANVTIGPFLWTHLKFVGIFDYVNYVSPHAPCVFCAARSRRLTANVTAGQRSIIYENTPGTFSRQFPRALTYCRRERSHKGEITRTTLVKISYGDVPLYLPHVNMDFTLYVQSYSLPWDSTME